MSSFVARARFRRDHRWTPDHMSDYLDGDLTARARQRVRRHIHECPECRRVLLGLQRMLGLLHGLPADESRQAPDITSAVRRRLRERADE